MATKKDKKDRKVAQDASDSDDNQGSGSSSSNFSEEDLDRYLPRTFDIYAEREPKEKILDEFTIDGIVSYINQSNCRNIIVMAGAGISTSAGIPDFRIPDSDLYRNLQKYDLPHQSAAFSIRFFHENPQPFFKLAKEWFPGILKPTICHYFVKLLHDKGLLLRHYTLNIDTLERVAGIPEEMLVEVHGTFNKGHCLQCRKSYTRLWMKEKILSDVIPPICEDCPGVVKPDIVFSGEALSEKFYKSVTDFKKCDLLIIMGAMLQGRPFFSLFKGVPADCPRLLLINNKRQKVSHGTFSSIGGPNNKRDVCWLGDCDEGCLVLADKLGWGKKLREIWRVDHERIDKEETMNKKQEAESEDGKIDNKL